MFHQFLTYSCSGLRGLTHHKPFLKYLAKSATFFLRESKPHDSLKSLSRTPATIMHNVNSLWVPERRREFMNNEGPSVFSAFSRRLKRFTVYR